MNYFVHLPLTSISSALPKLNPTLILDYSYPLKAPPTMPFHFSFNNEDATPICTRDENGCKLILQHGPTITLFVQNLPHKASNALEHGTKGNGAATSQNLTSMHRTSICIAFQNLT
jgi:hypothetical protein